MLLMLFLFCKKHQSVINVDQILSKVERPSFYELPTNQDIFSLENKFNVGATITGEVTEITVRNYEYFRSSIVVSAANFSNNFAFGSKSLASGLGGAIFVSYSTLFVEGAFGFTSNKANVGGAICNLMSNLYTTLEAGSQFKTNIAFKYGGAIYFQGIMEKSDPTKLNSPTLYSNKVTLDIALKAGQSNADTFSENKATELGGGILFSMAKAVTISDAIFINNQAGISGGAIGSINSALRITKCTFKTNKAGKLGNKHGSSGVPFQDSTPVFSGKGGGAIFMKADRYSRGFKVVDEKYIRVLSTESCCFNGNSAGKSTDFNGSPGHEVMLDGFVHWSSYRDIAKFNDKSVGCADRNGFKPLVSFVYTLSQTTGCVPAAINETAVEPVFTDGKRNGDANSVLYVPSPSLYAYQATPDPETPYATTSSWSKYVTRSARKDKPSPVTARETAFSTPFSSPFSTPFSTPFSSPFSSPQRTPFSTPMMSATPVPYSPPSILKGFEPSTFSTHTWVISNITVTESINEDGNIITVPTSMVSGFYTDTVAYSLVAITGKDAIVTLSSTQTAVNKSTLSVSSTVVDGTVSYIETMIFYVDYSNTFIYIDISDAYQGEKEIESDSSVSNTTIIIASVLSTAVFFAAVAVSVVLYRKNHILDKDEVNSSGSASQGEEFLGNLYHRKLYQSDDDNDPLSAFIDQCNDIPLNRTQIKGDDYMMDFDNMYTNQNEF